MCIEKSLNVFNLQAFIMGEGNKGTEDSGLSTLQYFFFSSELIAAFKSEIMPNCDSKLKATSAQ